MSDRPASDPGNTLRNEPSASESPITRQSLADGTMLKRFTALAGAGSVLTETERAARFDALMATIDPSLDVWLFAYGSMLWNPTVHHLEARPATIRNWHRSFCLRSSAGRGTVESPGLMLAIEPGGRCSGLGYRLAAAAVRTELSLLWQREMVTGAYRAVWVDGEFDHAELGGDHKVSLIAFVMDPASYAYEGALSEADQAKRIACAQGILGSNRDYLARTCKHLRDLGLRDDYIERLHGAVDSIEPTNQR